MPPALPLITLLTDFGIKDYFVASMKGVILTINPDARLIDISHGISSHQIAEAAYCLHACYRTFPEGAVHVVVVDPGVGGARRPILVTTSRYVFVAPDNGVLTPVFAEEQDVEIRHLENRRYQLDSPGGTFHGRDLFAPAAAWLTKGETPSSFGRLISDPIRLNWPQPAVAERRIIGEVVYIDCFGNLISNIAVGQCHMMKPGCARIQVGAHAIGNIVASYSDGAADVPHALINSNGMLEIFLKERSARDCMQAGVGTIVEVTW